MFSFLQFLHSGCGIRHLQGDRWLPFFLCFPSCSFVFFAFPVAFPVVYFYCMILIDVFLLIFFKPKGLCILPETLPALIQVVSLDVCTDSPADAASLC